MVGIQENGRIVEAPQIVAVEPGALPTQNRLTEVTLDDGTVVTIDMIKEKLQHFPFVLYTPPSGVRNYIRQNLNQLLGIQLVTPDDLEQVLMLLADHYEAGGAGNSLSLEKLRPSDAELFLVQLNQQEQPEYAVVVDARDVQAFIAAHPGSKAITRIIP